MKLLFISDGIFELHKSLIERGESFSIFILLFKGFFLFGPDFFCSKIPYYLMFK